MADCHLAFVLCLLIHSLLFGEYQQALGCGLEIWRLQHLWVSVLGVGTKLCAEVPFVQGCIKPLHKYASLLSYVLLLAGVPAVGGFP